LREPPLGRIDRVGDDRGDCEEAEDDRKAQLSIGVRHKLAFFQDVVGVGTWNAADRSRTTCPVCSSVVVFDQGLGADHSVKICG